MHTIEESKINTWMAEYGPRGRIGLYGSYVSALSLNNLQGLTSNIDTALLDNDLPLTYGNNLGSLRLRERIAELHSSPDVKITSEDVVITPGASMANYLLLTALCGKGDHIICQYPTFGPLYLVPKASGVDVSLWAMDEASGWSLNLEELAGLIKPNTKAIIINNPNNPTGAVIPRDELDQIAALANKHNVVLFSDEVFAPLFHGNDPPPPPLVSLGHPRTVSTGSVSKAHALPGIRVGWVISQDKDIMRRVATIRDYTTISVSQLDDSVAAFALSKEVFPSLMERNLKICAESVSLLDGFVKRNSERCRWVKPNGSGTCFIQVLNKDKSIADDFIFSKRLVDEVGVAVLPGAHAFGENGARDLKGYLRFGLGSPEPLREALPIIERFIQDNETF